MWWAELCRQSRGRNAKPRAHAARHAHQEGQRARRRASAKGDLADMSVHRPDRDGAAREMNRVARHEMAFLFTPRTDRYRAVEDVDCLVAIVAPDEPSSRALPDPRRDGAVVALRDRDAVGTRRPAQYPTRIYRSRLRHGVASGDAYQGFVHARLPVS